MNAAGQENPVSQPNEGPDSKQPPADGELGSEVIEFHRINRHVGHLIRRCRQIAVGIFMEEMVDFNITSVQYAALRIIQSWPRIDQRTLAEMAAIDRSTVGTLLERLEANGFIRREMPPHNQRIKQAFITPKGAAILAESEEADQRVQERLLEPLEPAERQMLIHLLEKMVRANNELSRAPARLRSATARK
jgi:MarR family transcriptional regulator, lower aerobic nicotinate degradation pathway regulator